QGRPETFDFLGFTHIAGVSKHGYFRVVRRTASERMRNKLKTLRVELRKRMHVDIGEVAKWLVSVVSGNYNYFGVHDNLRVLNSFGYQLGRTWFRTICRRSQRRKLTWRQFIDKWWRLIPKPRAVHPYPEERFYAKYSKKSPVR
ncbi:MAG: hypothetical protein LBR53_01250, partial [Deltaproteobacteria bacterium]|nr:hypothetical protein [Deltaproteobacteria bacterium]